MSDFLSNPDEAKEYHSRLPLLYFIIVVASFLFLGRLWYLQIVEGTELREFSEKNRIKEEKVPAPRGMVLDREGRVLVDNQPGFDAVIIPQYASELSKTASVIGKILGIPDQAIIKKVKTSRIQNGSFWPVRVKENLNRDEVARIERLRLDHPGLRIDMSIKRSYLLNKNGAQMYGYVGEISKTELPRINKGLAEGSKFEQGDYVGKSGLEQFYDPKLRGKDGLRFLQVDAHGREIAAANPTILGQFGQVQEAEPGSSMVLTIDKDIQEAAYEAFVKNDRIGALVALDPRNGEILAWVNAPSYDPNEFSTGISPKLWSTLINDPFRPLRNKVIQDHSPPGSTFKAIVALAALQEGLITTSTTHYCHGFLKFGRKQYHCHIKNGHGSVNVVSALEKSCDIFFYKMGMALGIDTIAKYARTLGLGMKTEVSLGGEIAGLVPTSDWKKRTLGEEWQPGENLSNAIGQGFILTTPLQVAQAFGGIAMDGIIYRPHLIKRLLDSEGHMIEEPPLAVRENLGNGLQSETKISPQVLAIVKEGLTRVVNSPTGTAIRSHLPGIKMAGKTGTVQLFSLSPEQLFVKCNTRPLTQRHHGWFVGFAPVEKPEIVIAVLAEHACSGSGGAAPLAKDVMMAYFKKYHPDWLKTDKSQPVVVPVAPPVED